MPTYGQDSQYQGNAPSYKDNGDGTITDTITDLMWSQTTDTNGDGRINVDDKMTLKQAQAYVTNLTLAGHKDWRLPSINELYSLILFDGEDVSINMHRAGHGRAVPFIDHRVFGFAPGDMSAGERLIDSQYVSSTNYVSTTMHGDPTVFGVNFIDGRIKGYGYHSPRGEKTFYVLAIRGNPAYGKNVFSDTGDGSIADKATGLTWQKDDSHSTMNFVEALKYCENLMLSGKDDWRLPNAKELQSIVDYSRAPATTGTASIDPLFQTTQIRNEAGNSDFANYWSSTTHKSANGDQGSAAYVAFGMSMGNMRGQWIDVHGAGSQRSDPKTGDAGPYANGRGPQGDAVRIQNMARCVRGGAIFQQSPTLTQRTPYAFTVPQGAGQNMYGGHMERHMNPTHRGFGMRPGMRPSGMPPDRMGPPPMNGMPPRHRDGDWNNR